MSQLEKLVNAYAEMFESERAYLQDLHLWGKELRRTLLMNNVLSPKKRIEIDKIVFGVIDNIISLHQKIMFEMAKINENCREDFIMEKCEEFNIDYFEILFDRKEAFKYIQYDENEKQPYRSNELEEWFHKEIDKKKAEIMNEIYGEPDEIEFIKKRHPNQKPKRKPGHILVTKHNYQFERVGTAFSDKRFYTLPFIKNDPYQRLIVQDTKSYEAYANINYEDVYAFFMPFFEIYDTYAFNMPRMEHTIFKELDENKNFKKCFTKFF
ncbi:hypothetical protein EDEG_02590 [Edhazardia aedis USNM 41457]|uniref:DH domain-containing protein n=1 Tax=Edhazardia aedis (strain USNM 41457) TaxID=1003232 RepID=J8ZTK2_EDHAE|nr:hypothetical protein EDEG_02590 [Edhazardia aedis USNM 41457]|eukprot:EJW03008.1 hypothetical protein EDEG_02590 [Edhazardia aedis USNM 41457]